MRLCWTGLILCVAMLGLPALAASAPLPPGLAGVWIDGGCDQGNRVRFINPLGVLEFTGVAGERQVQLALFQDVAPDPGGQGATAVLEAPTERRLLEQRFTVAGDRLDGTAQRCLAAPASLLLPFGEAIALFSAAGELQPICAEGSDGACFTRAFALADLTGDRRLSLGELARVLRGATFFAGYLAEGQAVQPAAPLTAPVALAGWIGPPLLRPLLEGSDYDADGALSAEELAQDRAAGPLPLADVAPFVAEMRRLLENLGALLELARVMLPPERGRP